jgi:hypothetical protein
VRRRVIRVGLIVMAVQEAMLGVWASIAPRHFYDTFPGGGRTWVSVDGPYNEHLLRDFGGLNLGLAIMAAVAAWLLTPAAVRTAAAALLAFGAPHLLYHATHLDVYDGLDKGANVVALSLAVAIPAIVLVASLAREPARPRVDSPVA